MTLRQKFSRHYEKYMYVVGIMGHFIFILQTHKIITNKSARDVSLEGFIVAFLSTVSWLIYGILKNDNVLIRVSAFGALASSTCIVSIVVMR